MRMNIKDKILIVEDDKRISGFIKAALVSTGYDVIHAATGKEAISMSCSHCPDLVLLDLGLPDIDGMDIISELRKWTNTPIVVVSARSDEVEKVKALDKGADDYVTKPFGTEELLARIRVALRHSHLDSLAEGSRSSSFTTGELTIHYDKHLVTVEGETVHLTQNEFKIVSLLSKYSGKVLTYDYIMKELWGPTSTGNNQILRVNMANIRRKIEKNPAQPQYIYTEIGVGYRMADGD